MELFKVLDLSRQDLSAICRQITIPLSHSFSLRQATLADIPRIVEVDKKSFGAEDLAMTEEMMTSRIKIFPEGNWVLQKEKEIVGVGCSMLISDDEDKITSWSELTGNGTISTHKPDGKALLGINVSLLPDVHGFGSAFLNEFTHILVVGLKLKLAFGVGRLLGYKEFADKMSPQEFLCLCVAENNILPVSPVVSFLMRAGGKLIKLVPNYWPVDTDSLGYGVLMEWVNPYWRFLS
ncbi:MAG: hypothetical protein WC460_05070 [Patescibacteria group bacterium]